MKPAFICWLLFAGGSVLAASPAGENISTPSPPAASPTPGVPAQELSGGFTRYIPDREGNYEWKMEGETVSFLSPVCLEITRLTATALAPRLEGLTITAGEVIYFTDSGIARHEGTRITVRREKMFLSGKGFLWTPANRQIRVLEDVRLLLQEGGEGGLFPK